MTLIKPSFILVVLFGGFLACTQTPQNESPKGMVYFEGGKIMIGSDDALPNEAPSFETKVSPFFIDKSPVTVAEFRAFVEETGYQTEAEEFGNSIVMNIKTGRWVLAEGANWKTPFGIGGPQAKDDHPVTQVSWNDAQAYSAWVGRRLPTEIEWEYAAKSGKNSGNKFSWGNELVENASYKANVWQGNFPIKNTEEDGFLYTSPVGEFGQNEAGVTDMGGNVWEWTSTNYGLYEGNIQSFNQNDDNKVIRGGSFLCHKEVCYGYRITARQFNSRESATFHMGFRTARSAE